MKKQFRLFKRDDNKLEMDPSDPGFRDRPYYFKFNFRGKRILRCLEVADAETAQKLAREKYKQEVHAIVTGSLRPPTLRATAPAGTVGQLLEAYKTSPVDAEESARRQNALAMRQLLRTAAGEPAPEGAPQRSDPNGPELAADVTTINGATVRRWFEHASKRALAAKDQGSKATIKRTANSRYVQAKSVLAPKAMATYKDLGLHHPGLEAFLEAGETFRFNKLPVTSFNPPSEAIIEKTLVAWQALEDRNLFLAIGHELAFGLRAAEWGAARWSWWTVRESYPVLDGTVGDGETVKNGTGRIRVRALDPWFNIMRTRVASQAWQGAPDDYIITGCPTARLDGAPRAVSAWLRALGWETKKTNHELRKYAGSQIAMRYGIYDAQCWLRHSTVKVTEQHYAGYVREFKPADADTLAARWATAPTAPQLRIVKA